MENKHFKNIKLEVQDMKQKVVYMPMVINTIVSFSAFFTDMAYSYDENNEFVRGPLGITTYIASAFYLIMLLLLRLAPLVSSAYLLNNNLLFLKHQTNLYIPYFL